METDPNVVCPVCTLFLRPGITLKAHLASHPKQMVIEALIRLAGHAHESQKQVATSTDASAPLGHGVEGWNAANVQQSPLPTNHSFIYQQFMSSSTPQQNVLNVNQLGQQYVYPTAVFNPQMMCPPYVYQQQQVIMSSGPQMPPLTRILPLPIEPAGSGDASTQHIIKEVNENIRDIDNEEQEPDLVIIETGDSNIRIQGDTKSDVAEDDMEVNEQHMKEDEKEITEPQVMQGGTILSLEEPLELVINSHNYDEADDKNYDEDRELGSPCSNASSNYIMDRDLNKSCQTMSAELIKDSELNDEDDEQKQFYFSEPTTENISMPSSTTYVTLTNTNHTGNVANCNEHSVDSQNVSLLDMDGMNLMLSNEFMNNQIIAQVEDFDYSNRCERPRILMNIGEYTETREIGDESISIDSANIRADEHMPPRGELSGQESNASDIAWSRLQNHESSSGMSTSYDLVARETWEGSDGSDNEDPPPLQSRVPPTYDNGDTPTVSGYTDPPIQYKCPTCSENFNCPKERRVHQSEKHGKNSNVIASKLGKKKVKKLVIKPKKEVKTETNFDNVFTNKLKIEAEIEVERASVILESGSQILEVKKDDALVSNPVVCTICEAVLADNAALKQHQLDIHHFNTLGDRYKCLTCEESFTCEPKFTEHLSIHPLECRLCGKYFYRRQNMQLHMKRHLGIKPYKCNICEKAFLTKQKLDEHRNVHTGESPIKCNLCDEVFRRHSNLVQHRNRHHFKLKKKVKDYICHCGEIFHSKKKLAWHKEVHENKPKACTQCSEKFIHASSLTRHMRRAHNERFVPKDERASENVDCPICKGVYLRSSLEVHIKNHSGQRPFTCLICNKDFTTKWNLKLHKWTHASRTQKPFKCDQCKGAFIRESDYVAHMNSHKSIKPYTCNYCGAQFIRKYNCQRHVREHEKVKMFTCTVCGKCFHRSYYLKDHMRVHSGVRPFSCHICGKTSTTKSNHNKHVRIHHAREPVSTEN